MLNENEKGIVLEKATLVAFLSLRGCRIEPFQKPDGRVAFRVIGNVTEALAELQQDPKINLLSYLNRLDAVRSVIFSLKERK